MKKRIIALAAAAVLTVASVPWTAAADEEMGWTDEYVPEADQEDPDGMYVVEDDGWDEYVAEDDYTEDYGDYDYTEDYGDYTEDNGGYTEDTGEYTEDTGDYTEDTGDYTEGGETAEGTEMAEDEAAVFTTDDENREYIEKRLDIYNVKTKWTYDADADAWVLTPTSTVAYPEIPKEQGISVAVPGAYVRGIDIDRDLEPDVTAEEVTDTVVGDIIIDYEAEIMSTNGQIYTASLAPVIINTGAAGYSEQQNQMASVEYAKEGYINVFCGNRGKQSTVKEESGNTRYTGDAPLCLVDQKNAVRFMKYNILLGNLPGSVDHFVSTGGSGGGAHAVMLAATSANPVFYEYEHEAGAVGIYKNSDGSFYNSANIFGDETVITDGVWGCLAYSPITSLAEADMAMAFEYALDPDYTFNTPFQKRTAEYLAEEYMNYINELGLEVFEGDVGIDLSNDGDFEDIVPLTIDYSEEDGYYTGSYLDLYLTNFELSLDHYVENLKYAEGWTWFGEDGNALSDEEVSAMTDSDRARAFIEGRYSNPSAGGMQKGPGGRPGDMGEFPGGMSGAERPDDMDGFPGGMSGAERPDGMDGGPGGEMPAGTPQQGTTQASGGSIDSSNYASFEEMLDSYREDIASIEAGDRYGNNIVELYDPMRFIGAEDTENPAWVRMLMGASEGDISMFNSLNLEAAFLSAGTFATAEWQWDGGHVPSEILGDSFALYVDSMYGGLVEGALGISKPEAEPQTENGSAEEASGTDISSWVSYDEELGTAFSLEDAAAYRTAGAAKAIPGFDVMDYGQEDYEFGSSEKDARHWNRRLLNVFEQNAEELAALFNSAG